MANVDSWTARTAQDLGSTDLFVVVVDSTKRLILGRVLVLDLVWDDAPIVHEPMNGETSLEGEIFNATQWDLRHVPEGRFNPPQIALVHRFAEEVAGQAATSPIEIEALVEAYERAQDVFVRGFVAMTGGYDSLVVNHGLRSASQPYAEARDAGTPTPEAHDTFIDAAVDAYIDSAGTPAQVAVAWGAFATLHDGGLAGRTTLTRLQSAQNLLHISITARQELAATVPDGTAGKMEVSAALDDILTAGMAATDMVGFVDAVAVEVEEGAAALQDARGSDLSAELQAADLSSHIDTLLSPEEIAAGLPDYLGRVESEADDAELVALLIALMGGPGWS